MVIAKTNMLERTLKRHSAVNSLLMASVVLLFLLVFNGCDVKLPEKTQEKILPPPVEAWVETRGEDIPEDLTFAVTEDGTGVEVYLNGAIAHTLVEGDTFSIFKYRVTISLVVGENKLTVTDGEETVTEFNWTTI